VLTERVFSCPGIGGYLVVAVISRDLYVVLYVLLLVVLLVVAVIFATDFAAFLINPVGARGGDDGDGDSESAR
jgi:ABC-type dipeptide/oligopeptide/nickel transport system permease component